VIATLRWRPSPLARSLASCALTALAAALLTQQWQLVVFAAPLLGALSAGALLASPPRELRATGAPDSVRCFEFESAELSVTVALVGGTAELTVRPVLTEGMALVDAGPPTTTGGTVSAAYRLRAQRWGSYPVQVQVTAVAAGGLLVAGTTAAAAHVRVYPLAPPQQTLVPHPELSDRLGTHLTRRHGSGVEYADIRAYVPGDQLRSVNWPVSARRGQLHVTERFIDRAAGVVAVIDTYPQPRGPADAALERSVRGATQVVQAALQRGDRAGVVVLGRRPRWLGPDIGRRQFYRILDTVLDAGELHPAGAGTLAPRHVVPQAATVVAFSTLLETDFALALLDLRRRGHAVVAVDVLRGAPFAEELDPIAAQLWRLERKYMHRNLGMSGVDVIEWPEDIPLERALTQLSPASTGHRPRQRMRHR